MFEKMILKQILIFNLESKIKNERPLEKVSLILLLEKIRKEVEE